MNFLELFNGIGPISQLTLIVGCFATIFLIAFNRDAGKNLILFLRNLREIRFHKHITIEVIQKHNPPLDVDDNVRLGVHSEEKRENIIEEQAVPKMKR